MERRSRSRLMREEGRWWISMCSSFGMLIIMSMLLYTYIILATQLIIKFNVSQEMDGYEHGMIQMTDIITEFKAIASAFWWKLNFPNKSYAPSCPSAYGIFKRLDKRVQTNYEFVAVYRKSLVGKNLIRYEIVHFHRHLSLWFTQSTWESDVQRKKKIAKYEWTMLIVDHFISLKSNSYFIEIFIAWKASTQF